jgi:hypothetical protein
MTPCCGKIDQILQELIFLTFISRAKDDSRFVCDKTGNKSIGRLYERL